MELNHLHYFFTVAREGGFTRAAKKLRVQQPGISKIVRQLESDLGVTLLEREKRRTRLTKAGEEIFGECEKIFQSVETIKNLSNRERLECHGPLRFGCSDSVASALLPRVLRRYLKSHPGVRPSIFTGTSGMICDEIAAHRIEFGIFFTVPEDATLEATELAQIPFRLVVAGAKALSAAERPKFIGSREVDYPKARSFPVMEMLRAKRLDPEVVISSNNLDSHRQFVLQGLGMALLPDFMVSEDLRKGRMRVVHPEKTFSYGLRLVTRKGKVLPRNAVVFLEFLRQSLEKATDARRN